MQKFKTRVAAGPFQLWTLEVYPDQTATLTCEDGTGRAVFAKRMLYTDFPLAETRLHCTDNTILLLRAYGGRSRPSSGGYASVSGRRHSLRGQRRQAAPDLAPRRSACRRHPPAHMTLLAGAFRPTARATIAARLRRVGTPPATTAESTP